MSSGKRTGATGAAEWLPGAAVLAVWIAMLLVGGNLLDRTVVRAVHVSDGAALLAAIFLTSLGDWAVLLALSFFGTGWLALKRKRRLALLLLGSVMAARLLVGLQKTTLARARPDEFEYMVTVSSFAYPSGHAANSMITYLLLALLVVPAAHRRLAVAGAVLLSVLIGVSRVLLGVHWPSDVIGGWAFGLLWVLLTLIVGRRWAGLEPPVNGSHAVQAESLRH